MTIETSPLLTDYYQLGMLDAYYRTGRTETAVFEFFFRQLPNSRRYLVTAGLELCLDYLEELCFTDDDINWLQGTNRFSSAFVDTLRRFRFTGDVDAMPEGTAAFPDEPILRVTAPLPEAQFVETRLINILHFHTLIASKAAHLVSAAPDRQFVDFGLRRAHGAEAGLMAARACYIAGFAGTATVLANKRFAVPLFGTMSHAFVQAHDTESAAFEAFARARPDNPILLIDTYDTEAAAHKVVELAPTLTAAGIAIGGVRLDSGDLSSLSKRVRHILDEGGLSSARILVSGGLDQAGIQHLVEAGAPVDGFGVGTSLTTSEDAPALDCAYKLQEYAGLPRRKRSAGKATWPGRKQVWRHFGSDDVMTGDVVSTSSDHQQGQCLLQPVMRGGRRIAPSPTLEMVRSSAAATFHQLPPHLKQASESAPYPVTIGEPLIALTAAVDRLFR